MFHYAKSVNKAKNAKSVDVIHIKTNPSYVSTVGEAGMCWTVVKHRHAQCKVKVKFLN